MKERAKAYLQMMRNRKAYAAHQNSSRRDHRGGGRKAAGEQQINTASGITSVPWAEPTRRQSGARATASLGGTAPASAGKAKKLSGGRSTLARLEAATIRANRKAILDRIGGAARSIAQSRDATGARNHRQLATALSIFGEAEKNGLVPPGTTQAALSNLALSVVGQDGARPATVVFCGQRTLVYYVGDSEPPSHDCGTGDAFTADLTDSRRGVKLLTSNGYRHDDNPAPEAPNTFIDYGLPDPVTLGFIQQVYTEYTGNPNFAKTMIDNLEKTAERY
jgi:hypothetical protein